VRWSKHDEAEDRIVGVVSTDGRDAQSGWVSLDGEHFGLPSVGTSIVDAHDLLSGASYQWRVGPDEVNCVALDPARFPAHLLHLVPREHEAPAEDRAR